MHTGKLFWQKKVLREVNYAEFLYLKEINGRPKSLLMEKLYVV